MILLGLLVILLLAVLNALPLAFFAMLFLGNVGLHLSFLTVLPGAIAIKAIGSNLLSAPTVVTK